MTKFGLNSQLQHADARQKDTHNAVIAQTNAPCVTIINDAKIARDHAHRFPNTIFMLRKMLGAGQTDDNVHRSDAFRNDPNSADPIAGSRKFVDWYMDDVHGLDNMCIVADNEPQTGTSRAMLQELLQWLEGVGQICKERKIRCVLGNWSVGQPHESDNLDVLRPLWELAAANKRYLSIGLHEYMAHTFDRSYPLLVGRVKTICDKLGVYPIIDITEAGFDTFDAAKHPYFQPSGKYRELLTMGVSRSSDIIEQYVRQYAFYAPLPYVRSVQWFSYGSDTAIDTTWALCDITYRYSILEGIIEQIMAIPTTYEPGQDTPPPLKEVGTHKLSGFNFKLNFRIEPALSGAWIGELQSGDVVNLTGEWRTANGYDWRECYSPRLDASGWFAEVNGVTLTAVDTTPTVFDFDKLREHLNAAIKMLDDAGL